MSSLWSPLPCAAAGFNKKRSGPTIPDIDEIEKMFEEEDAESNGMCVCVGVGVGVHTVMARPS